MKKLLFTLISFCLLTSCSQNEIVESEAPILRTDTVGGDPWNGGGGGGEELPLVVLKTEWNGYSWAIVSSRPVKSTLAVYVDAPQSGGDIPFTFPVGATRLNIGETDPYLNAIPDLVVSLIIPNRDAYYRY